MAVKLRAFEGVPRKVVIPCLWMTAVGWFLVAVGFGIGSQKYVDIELFDYDDYEDGDYEDSRDYGVSSYNDPGVPTSYPYWIVCVSGGPAIVIALLHAALWKPLSPILGSVAAFLSALFLTGLGMVLYNNSIVIHIISEENDSDDGEDVSIPAWFSLEVAGAVIAILFWTLVMVLWHFYDFKAGRGQERIWAQGTSVRRRPFRGAARKLAVPFILLTGISVAVVAIGFGISAESKNPDTKDGPNDKDDPLSYPLWIVCTSGPVLMLTAFVHGALWWPYSPYIGAIATILNTLFLTGLGMTLLVTGLQIYYVCKVKEYASEEDDDTKLQLWYILEFAGAGIAALLWTPVLMLWHFYDDDFGACKACLVPTDQRYEAQPLLNYTEELGED